MTKSTGQQGQLLELDVYLSSTRSSSREFKMATLLSVVYLIRGTLPQKRGKGHCWI